MLFYNYYSDIANIQKGIGDKLSEVLRNFSLFMSGFIIAFIVDWRVALVVCTMVPLTFIQGFFIQKVN